MHIKTRTVHWLFALLLCCAGAAQSAAPITVDTLEITGKNARGEPIAAGQVNMPFVRSSNAAITAHINDALFLDQFGTLAPKNPGKSFNSGDGINAASQDFTFSGEGGRILSINFEIEGCGAYCERYHSIQNFDTATGRKVNDHDILTAAGMRDLARQMARERLSRFKKEMAVNEKKLKAAKKNKSIPKDVIEDLNDRITLNSDCADREQEKLKDESDLALSFEYYTHEHENNRLTLTSGRCSNHAMRALDDVGDVSITVPYAKLRPYLTSYGKALLLAEGSAKPTSFYNQILRGQLNGNIAITMQLNKGRDGTSVSGLYFYDKFGKPIEISGTQSGGELILTERLGNDAEAGATMKLVVAGSQLKGQWIGKKQFPVQLSVP